MSAPSLGGDVFLFNTFTLLMETKTMKKIYDFDQVIDRSGTDSYKWQLYGKDILSMWIADMDFPVADEICEALKTRVDHPIFGYATAPKTTLDCVIRSLKDRFNWDVKPEWLVWLPGVVPAINASSRAFAGPGKGVLVNPPVYTQIFATANLSHSEQCNAQMKQVDGQWELDKEAMEKAVKPNTTLLILCSPHNPIGHLFTEDELKWIDDFAEKHQLIVCSDEIHCDLVLDPTKKHIPTATIGERMADRCLTFMAPSKTYNIPGLGCAYAIIKNPEIRARFNREIEHIIPHPNVFAYTACEAAYTYGGEWLKQCLNYLRDNAEFCFKALNEMPYIKATKPEATYLIWLDCSQIPVENPFGLFLENGLALDKGECFGNCAYLRLNFACPRSTLEEGLNIIRKALASIKK